MFWLVTVSCSKFSRELSLKVNDIMSPVSPVSKCGWSATKKSKCDQLQSARVARKNCSEPASESGTSPVPVVASSSSTLSVSAPEEVRSVILLYGDSYLYGID